MLTYNLQQQDERPLLDADARRGALVEKALGAGTCKTDAGLALVLRTPGVSGVIGAVDPAHLRLTSKRRGGTSAYRTACIGQPRSSRIRLTMAVVGDVIDESQHPHLATVGLDDIAPTTCPCRNRRP